MINNKEKIKEILSGLYPNNSVDELFSSVQLRMDRFTRIFSPAKQETHRRRFDEKDIILICYGDHLSDNRQSPLAALNFFIQKNLSGLINSVHLLPFFSYSSDDGFAIIDYREVSGSLGSWSDVWQIGSSFNLMADIVINHVSSKNPWFAGFIEGNNQYTDYFISVEPGVDLSKTARPRSTPLLTPFETKNGTKYVWTTFSNDQVDLNFSNLQVFLEMLDILLYYLQMKIKIIRLDAIAYLWKIPGSTCINLPQTHNVIKLFRLVLDEVAPYVSIVTETNVPHEENLQYFGEFKPEIDGTDEAQIIYQFALAPLILHTYASSNAGKLLDWVENLPVLPRGNAFLNFVASHDGIGLRPVEQLLSADEIRNLVDAALDHGGKVSRKTNSDGTESVYELNITWYDALNDPKTENTEIDIDRFMGSQVIMLSLAGIAGIYFPSLFGGRNCKECIEVSGQNRSINREKFNVSQLESGLKQDSRMKKVFERYQKILGIRNSHEAFSPESLQKVLKISPSVFSVLRESVNGEKIVCLVNVTDNTCEVQIPGNVVGSGGDDKWRDFISGDIFDDAKDGLSIRMNPYQSLWLTIEK